MLNLSDIRKKARKGKKGAKPVIEEDIQTEVQDLSDQEEILVEGTLLDDEMTSEELAELEALERAAAAEEEAELSSAVASVSVPPAQESDEYTLSEDELQELLRLEEALAAEEERQAEVKPSPAAKPIAAPPASKKPSAKKEAVPVAVDEPEIEPEPEPYFADPLEALFNFQGEVDFATEEAYFQGLVGEAVRSDENLRQMLSFSLGEEEYMIDIRDVREIIKMREITDIPRAPYFILGIISLRGNIIPVFDLKKRLKLGAVEDSPDVRIVVCQKGELIVGLMVERINQVVRLPQKNIESTPAILSGLDRDLVEGVGRYQGKMMILLDLPSVMDAELF